MGRLTTEEREQASQLGNQLIDLLTSRSPLVAGFALAAVLRSMPPVVQEAMRTAQTLVLKAIEWNRKISN
jgi:hypothetical protein